MSTLMRKTDHLGKGNLCLNTILDNRCGVFAYGSFDLVLLISYHTNGRFGQNELKVLPPLSGVVPKCNKMASWCKPLSLSHTRYIAPRVEFLNQIFMVLIKPFCDLMSEHQFFWAKGSCGRNIAMEFAPKWDNSGEMENLVSPTRTKSVY